MLSKKKIFVAVVPVLMVGVLALCGMAFTYAKTKPMDDRICEGVYIDDLNLSGMTMEEAQEAVNGYVEGLLGRNVSVDVGGEKVITPLESLGFTCEDNAFVEEAFQFGKKGNVIKRFKEMRDVEQQNVVYNLNFSINEKKVRKFVEGEGKRVDVKAKNASLKRVNGKFVVTDATVGRHLEVDETVALIMDGALQGKEAGDVVVQASITEDVPEFTTEQAELCNAKMGTFSTNVEGTADRVFNVDHATGFIDGSVIYPGEEYSVAQTIYPLTSDNGYKEAPSYMQGQVVDSLGGGVCQVSTTLYNALLRAEMKITERHPHSMIVSYVEPAMDAAIAGDYKDLKFRNDTDAPVYIEGYLSSGRVLTFNIYGHETRDVESRKVEYDSEILERINPGKDIVRKDNSLPETYQKVEQSAHVGYRANLWKIVTVNGKQESKDKVNYSTYRASPRYLTVGTKKVKDKDVKSKKTNKKERDAEDDDEGEVDDSSNGEDATEPVPTDSDPTVPSGEESVPPVEEPVPPVEG